MPSKMRPKHEIVLRALGAGLKVELDGHTWAMDENFLIGTVGVKEPSGEEVLLLHEVSFNYFIKACNKLTDEEAAGIAANTALTKINDESRGGLKYNEVHTFQA